MNSKIVILLIVSILLLGILSACSTPDTLTRPTGPAPPEKATQENTEASEEVTEEEEETATEEVISAAIDASALYQANCSRCHAADRSGSNGPALLPDRLTAEPSYYLNVITNGSGPMPSFGGRLSGEEISALVEFIRSEP
jgi:mono/diheme cytochrome c family protein